MKKITLIILLIAAFQSICAQSATNSLSLLRLKGKVKEVDLSYFGGVDNPDTLAITRKVVFLFDTTGNEIEEQDSDYSKDGIFTVKTIFIYNERGENVETECIDSLLDHPIKKVFKYDNSSRCIESDTYAADDEIYKIKFLYDDKGRKIEEDSYGNSYKLDQMTAKMIPKYDNNGNVIEQNIYLATNGFTERRIYEYDNNGFEIKNALYNKINKLIGANESNYVEFDSKDNWLKIIVKHYQYIYGKGDSTNTFILKREISYY